MKIHLVKNRKGYRIAWVARNGKQVALTGDGYTRKDKAVRAAEAITAAYKKAFEAGLPGLPLVDGTK